ncbi:hypothetical protein [Thermus albus]|uniref:hypothetical protein n=1 Tax=Thermus albus TaxID=2908146 RepID=UPI001FAA5140|nr:hypothetical protein [Thermus albus]
MGSLLPLLRSLRNPLFARLYAAQTTSLLGDAFTRTGLRGGKHGRRSWPGP